VHNQSPFLEPKEVLENCKSRQTKSLLIKAKLKNSVELQASFSSIAN